MKKTNIKLKLLVRIPKDIYRKMRIISNTEKVQPHVVDAFQS